MPRRLGDEEKATAAQTLLDWQFTDRMKIEGLFRKDILEILTTMGTAITYTGWAKKTRKVRSQKKEEQALLDQSGQPIIDDYGNPLSIPVSVVVEGPGFNRTFLFMVCIFFSSINYLFCIS